MLNMSAPGELKSPCVTRNGMVKLPPAQPNGMLSASITKGTPAAKNRLCQSSSASVPSILPPPTLLILLLSLLPDSTLLLLAHLRSSLELYPNSLPQ